MPVNLRAQVLISERMKQAMRIAPQIMSEELTDGMQEADEIRKAVQEEILSAGLVETGDLLKSAHTVIYTRPDTARVTGVVGVGSRGRGPGFYAPIHERGGTIRPKKGEWLYIPIGKRVLITHREVKGEMRALKNPRMETIAEKFVRVKQVTIKPRWYFRKGLRRKIGHVEQALNRAGERGVARVFEGGE